jgi:hypothetical protein
VAIATNPHSGISGANTVWDQGVEYPGLVRGMDIVWTEEGNEAGVSAEGILVSKIRTYKMATTLHKRVLTYTAGTGGSKLQMAESMAYNRQGLGMVGGVLAGYDLPEDQRKYIDFFRRNFSDYRDVENIADIAVLQSHNSMGFNNDLPWQSAMLLEQVLIQAKIPFDIIFDDNLKDLGRYKALALPDQECLSDEQAGLIREFVNRGGGLVATELTSLYTNWRERRRDFALKDLFHVTAPEWRESEIADQIPPGGPVRNEFGHGRVVYIPKITPARVKAPSKPMISAYWMLPLNGTEIVDCLRWAAGGFRVEVTAPNTVAAEVMEQRQAKKLLVHLLNYDVARTPTVSNVGVKLRLPKGSSAAERVILLSPDEATGLTLPHKVLDGAVEFVVPHLNTYDVAVIQ